MRFLSLDTFSAHASNCFFLSEISIKNMVEHSTSCTKNQHIMAKSVDNNQSPFVLLKRITSVCLDFLIPYAIFSLWHQDWARAPHNEQLPTLSVSLACLLRLATIFTNEYRVLVVSHPFYLFSRPSMSSRVWVSPPKKPYRWLALLYTSRQISSEARVVLSGIITLPCRKWKQRNTKAVSSNLLLTALGGWMQVYCLIYASTFQLQWR